LNSIKSDNPNKNLKDW